MIQEENRQQEEQAERLSASKIGKFNTPDELLSAYNALQSEFTKRCQSLKRLQAELDAIRAQAEKVTDAESAEPSVPIDTAEDPSAEACDGDGAPSGGNDADSACGCESADTRTESVAETAERLADIPEVMDACISRYKARLIGSRQSAAPSGLAVIVPAKRPKTLSEAKRLADEILAGI